MCGRFILTSTPGEIAKQFDVPAKAVTYKTSYNITPSASIPVVRLREDTKELALCQWGLKPHWAKEKNKYQAINARAETVAEKPYFRQAYKTRRCLIPCNGFYEWQRSGKQKQPWYFTVGENELFAFAGLWEHWQNEEQSLDSCAIITTNANAEMKPVHDRMPVIIDRENYNDWLEVGGHELLKANPGKLTNYPISTRVNSPANNDAGLIARISD